MSLAPAHVAELDRALTALELLVATRLEERRCGTGPDGLFARRPPPSVGEGLPPLEEFTGSGPLVVLAHGMGDSRESYRFVVPQLVEAG